MATKRKPPASADEKRRAQRRAQSASLMRQLRARQAAERGRRIREFIESEG